MDDCRLQNGGFERALKMASETSGLPRRLVAGKIRCRKFAPICVAGAARFGNPDLKGVQDFNRN